MGRFRANLTTEMRRRFILLRPLLATLAAVAASWAVLFVAIPPRLQNFPMMDDWSFAHLAFRLARGGGIRYDGWPSMPVLGQCLWAVPFVWAFGESYLAMRMSTVVLSALALIAFFDLLQSVPGVSRRSAAFGTAALAFNPFFYALSSMFMTDVPALAFSMIALALARRGAASARMVLLVAGGLAAVLATTDRQNAIAAPLAIAVLPAKNAFTKKALRVICTGAPLAAGLGTALWFAFQENVDLKSIHWPEGQHIADMLLRHHQVLGLSAIPVLLLRPRRLVSPGYLFWLAVFGAWTWGWIYFNNRWYRQPYMAHIQPLLGDSIRSSGLYFHQSWAPWLPKATRISLTVIGCFGLAGLVAGPGGSPRLGAAGRGILAFTAVNLILMSMTRPVFDRYMIYLLPGLMLQTVPRTLPDRRPTWWLGLAALGLLAAGGIALTHDWLGWNAARWELGRRAIERGVDPEDIEGGWEWNGCFASQIRKRTGIERPAKGLAIADTRDAFPNVRGGYAIDLVGGGWGLPPSMRPPTIVVDYIDYRPWLSPRSYRFELLKVK
jgi:hypothetical protein